MLKKKPVLEGYVSIILKNCVLQNDVIQLCFKISSWFRAEQNSKAVVLWLQSRITKWDGKMWRFCLCHLCYLPFQWGWKRIGVQAMSWSTHWWPSVSGYQELYTPIALELQIYSTKSNLKYTTKLASKNKIVSVFIERFFAIKNV